MRKLASIRSVSEIYEIENADFIELCVVDGWEIVSKKGQYHVGESIVYIEIDSVVPETEHFEFLRDRHFRIKTIKLRKQISQGLIMPLSILPEGSYNLGDDVTDILGITKYETRSEQEANRVQEQSVPSWFKKLMKFRLFRMTFGNWYKKKYTGQGKFPDWIIKTDETRVQNMVALYGRLLMNNVRFNVTEKIDGQSATYGIKKSNRKIEYVVCSRNIRRPKEDDSSFWCVSRSHDIEHVLKDIRQEYDFNTVVLQGEIIGTGIQANKYNMMGYDFYAFNLIIDGYLLSYQEMEKVLNRYNIKCVPIIEEDFILPPAIAQLVNYSIMKSTINPNINREGIVLRSLDISFKVINPNFLLKECKDD